VSDMKAMGSEELEVKVFREMMKGVHK